MIGARVVWATWPGPMFVAPHSTMPVMRRSGPVIAATRGWISPLPRDTNVRTIPRLTSPVSTGSR